MTAINEEKSKNRCILITGVAGFIGSHLAHSLLEDKVAVVGVDSLSDYYPVEIKLRRLASLRSFRPFVYYHACVSESKSLTKIFETHTPTLVIHLAAQAGVVTQEHLIPSYIKSNIYGAEMVMRLCARLGIPLIYASSSSVYGDCPNVPFLESEATLLPKSLYAASKLYNEQVASFYAKHFNLKAVGLRFFSIYGEDMRPDMAISLFTSAIYHSKPITLYGNNATARDFTYIKDLVYVIKQITQKLQDGETLASIYNIGSQSPVPIERVVRILEELLNKTSKITHSPLRLGEAQLTYSDSSLLYRDLAIRPTTTIEEGLKCYVRWYLDNLTMQPSKGGIAL